jgi:hypothetical protein
MTEKPVGMTFEVRPDIEGGVYSNIAAIVHSPNEFIFDFAVAVPGKETAAVRARIITSPQHAKQFLMALQENIINYERVHGEIEVSRPVTEVVSRTTH